MLFIESYSSLAYLVPISFDTLLFSLILVFLHFKAGVKTHPKPPDAKTFPPLLFFFVFVI